MFNQAHSQLSTIEGGIGEPDIDNELRCVAAMTVGLWAQGRSPSQQLIGGILLWKPNKATLPSQLPLPVHHADTKASAWQNSLWTTGAKLLARIHGEPRQSTEVDGIRCVLEMMAVNRYTGAWEDGWWTPDHSGFQPELTALRRVQTDAHGVSDLRWLPSSHIFGYGVFLTEPGTDIQCSGVNLIASRFARVDDVVRYQWKALGQVSFRYNSLEYPLVTKAANQFRRFCDIIVANCPRIIHRPQSELEVSTYEKTEHVWTLHKFDSRTHIGVEIFPAPVRILNETDTMDKAERIAGAQA